MTSRMFDRFRKKDKDVSISSPEDKSENEPRDSYDDIGIIDELERRKGDEGFAADADTGSESTPEEGQHYKKENPQQDFSTSSSPSSSTQWEGFQPGHASSADTASSTTAATSQLGDEIGIRALMDQRAKLQDSLDYIGMMIRSLKDKRTGLEKEVEEEWVDIKKLKEQLQKVSEYIEDETRGLKSLIQKRTQVENDAKEVANLIESLRGKIASIDDVVNQEGNRIKSFKDQSSATGQNNHSSSTSANI